MLIQENLSIEEKLRILSDAAKYDAACTSSGVGRKGKEGFLGNSRVDGICHSMQAVTLRFLSAGSFLPPEVLTEADPPVPVPHRISGSVRSGSAHPSNADGKIPSLSVCS